MFLIHLHKIDFKIAFDRNLERKELNWSKQDVEKGYCYHNLIDDENKLKEWFKSPIRPVGELENIPQKFKDIV